MSQDDFQALHAGLNVSMIATGREHFAYCRLDDSLRAVAERNESKFDFMPVVEGGEGNGHIVGTIQLDCYFEAPAPDTPVSGAYRPLHENCLIGADASILSFVKEADIRPFRLLVSDQGVVGLVSLSDLQKLPVRAALFGLVTGLEIAMTEAIQVADPNGEKWLNCISAKRQDDLRKRIEDARSKEGIVTELLFTQFCDKRDILISLLFSKETARRREELERTFKRIEDLRNDLAHANDYAANRQHAARVCSIVRDILDAHKIITPKA
ncbi:hypothetical protein [Mesorhizobium sp.]|uniref:hypothetical protein n=1 Tax=Mesorhizobium sp. TaxID=1871066 RepID=UPI000FE49283|nr:hypothetical protein [Mesorhizobium sp.]RWK41714.1 MAG: hypothetical protein EOR46_15585 [Mesorhizobium sp.]RWK71067.1 MAG: hypothetical protein EOR54_02815 [Mesorhizobium sp.]RWK76081.1 MAG: hypothetical protein EOR50_15670 [Mesorhizobium sp.]RWK84451.1 MAG: hypothetical protein EOR51_02305 [Mesorhizobium sp.]RWL05062.1 MAG: hypothetical protein EOR55_14090 [Mesorhizobium sp.]